MSQFTKYDLQPNLKTGKTTTTGNGNLPIGSGLGQAQTFTSVRYVYRIQVYLHKGWITFFIRLHKYSFTDVYVNRGDNSIYLLC
jgi:hypothetical protein